MRAPEPTKIEKPNENMIDKEYRITGNTSFNNIKCIGILIALYNGI